MRKYGSLRFVAVIYQILAYFILIVGLLATYSFYSVTSFFQDAFYGMIAGIGGLLLTITGFVGLLFLSQSITLMLNLANDIYSASNNSFVIAEFLEKELTALHKKNADNQELIIKLLSGEKINSKSIDPNDI